MPKGEDSAKLTKKERRALMLRAEECAIQYDRTRDSITKMAEAKNVLEEELKGIMELLQRDTLEFPDPADGKRAIRISKYKMTRVSYNLKKLVPYLKKHPKVRKLVCKVVLDGKALERAFNTGLIPYDVIKNASETSSSDAFKVAKVKARKD